MEILFATVAATVSRIFHTGYWVTRRELPYWRNRGCFVTFLGIFSMRGERYYVHMEGSTWGEIETNIRKKTQNSEKLKFLFWVEGTLGRWGEVCKVRYARWGMWGGVCEVGYLGWAMRGGLHEVSYMKWVMQDGSCEVGHMRWDMWGGSLEVSYASHLVKFFTPWYFSF